ncbi:MAG: radical SAM protein [Bacteroidaceae bacterium]|nr:radical SAM protein [Bacteroidaceae bacterium]
MEIRTRSGNIYSYNKHTGEILGGSISAQLPVWDFAPFVSFESMPQVDSFILGITEQCNLRCTYCCYSGSYVNKRVHNITSMDSRGIDEILAFIDSFTGKRPIKLFIYGGEPLLNYNLVKYTIEKSRKRWSNDVSFTISTNGTTLTKERIDWLVANNIVLALSIDGTKPFHDSYRVDAQGNGSYTRVYDALKYIKTTYPEYAKEMSLIMTLASFDKIVDIAEAWHNDEILHDMSPTMMNSLAPNFSQGVDRADYEEVKEFYDTLLDTYEKHQDWVVLRKLLESCVAYWKERPIFEPSSAVPMATCLPNNTKLYIDSNLQIGVCEKMSDNYRIGNIKDGIDWVKANSVVRDYYNKRVERCKDCSAVRMCNMCLTAMEYTDEQWDILCHNELVYTRVFMYLFCEMAERGLIR